MFSSRGFLRLPFKNNQVFQRWEKIRMRLKNLLKDQGGSVCVSAAEQGQSLQVPYLRIPRILLSQELDFV